MKKQFGRACRTVTKGLAAGLCLVVAMAAALPAEAGLMVRSRPSDVVSTVRSPVKVTTLANGHTLVDFGKDAAGYVQFDAKGAGSYEMIVGEALDGNGAVNNTLHAGLWNCYYSYVTDKNGKKVECSLRAVTLAGSVSAAGTFRVPMTLPWQKRFDGNAHVKTAAGDEVCPFRYVEVVSLPSGVSAADLRQVMYHYPFDYDDSSFTSSDANLNQVYDLCKWSLYADSYLGYWLDGDRERQFYQADAYVTVLDSLGVFSDMTVNKRTAKEFFVDELKHEWSVEWYLYTFLTAFQDYWHSGDISTLQTYYDHIKPTATTKKFYKIPSQYQLENGLLASPKTGWESSIVDWPQMYRYDYDMGKSGTNGSDNDDGRLMPIENALLCQQYRDLATTAAALGKTADAAEWSAMATKIYNAYQDVFFDASCGLYRDKAMTNGYRSARHSIQANAAALAFGMVPADRVATVAEFVATNGMRCGTYMAHLVLEGLGRAGRADAAIAYMASTAGNSWMNMINEGLTTCCETWSIASGGGVVGGAPDVNHTWSCAPASIVSRYVLGVRPAAAGWAKAVVAPQFGSLTKASGKVPTAKGSVTVDYQDKTLTVTVPTGLEADITFAGQTKTVSATTAARTVTIVESGSGHTHSWSAYAQTTAPTCTTAGEEQATCACGQILKKEIPALGHDWSGEWQVVTEATETTPGEKRLACKRSGCDAFQSEVIPPSGEDPVDPPHTDVPLELSKIFQSQMVLQRDRAVRVWGKGPMGKTVTVSFGGQAVTSAAIGADDLWEVTFPQTFAANATGRTLTATCSDGASVTLTNVLVGDVWIAAGQSNMVMPVKGSAYGDTYDADETVADMANHPQIRWMAMDVKYGQAPEPEPYEVKGGTWDLATRKLSAVAYHFAHDCVTAHPEVPIGIIGAYCNALSISYWKPGGTKTLWNCQLAPITRLAVRGAIWYQGESDAWGTQIRDHRHYSTDGLEPMVAAWRREFGVEAADFPFYFVQLAGYLNGSSADDPSGDSDNNYRAARESMLWARRHIENCGMAVAWDCGRLKLEGEEDVTCQHPKCKGVLGKRLALLALKNVYGDDVVAESPYWTETVTDGKGNIRVKFDMNGSSGLTTALKNWNDAAWPVKTPGETLKGFAVAGSDKKWYWADAVIESADTIRLSSSDVAAPLYVRYCYRNNPVGGIANGYNEEMLPIAPIATEYAWYADVRKEGGDDPEPEIKTATLPTAKTGLTYTGQAQTGVPSGTGYAISGNTGTDAGNYTATVTLAEGYRWTDGNTARSRTVPWTIAKGVNAWTTRPSVSPATWTEGCAPATIAISTGANAFGAAVAGDATESALKELPAGTHVVTFTAAGCANYDAITTTVTVTVTAGEDPPAPGEELLADGGFEWYADKFTGGHNWLNGMNGAWQAWSKNAWNCPYGVWATRKGQSYWTKGEGMNGSICCVLQVKDQAVWLKQTVTGLAAGTYRVAFLYQRRNGNGDTQRFTVTLVGASETVAVGPEVTVADDALHAFSRDVTLAAGDWTLRVDSPAETADVSTLFDDFSLKALGGGPTPPEPETPLVVNGAAAWTAWMQGVDTEEKLAAVKAAVSGRPTVTLAIANFEAGHDDFQVNQLKEMCAFYGLAAEIVPIEPTNPDAGRTLDVVYREAFARGDLVIDYKSYWTADECDRAASVIANCPERLFVLPYGESGSPVPPTSQSLQGRARHADGSGLANMLLTVPLVKGKYGSLTGISRRTAADTETAAFVSASAWAASGGDTCQSASMALVAAAWYFVARGDSPSAAEIVRALEAGRALPRASEQDYVSFTAADRETLQAKVAEYATVDALGRKKLLNDAPLNLGGVLANMKTQHVHAWGAWVTEIPATCEEYGRETRVCAAAGCADGVGRRTLLPLGHDWGAWTTDPEKETRETRVCRRAGCGATDVRTFRGLDEAGWGWRRTQTVDGTNVVILAFTNVVGQWSTVLPAEVAAIDYVVVAGGGGGGAGNNYASKRGGGGGGAGGLLHGVQTGAGRVVVEVGRGGAPGKNGFDSTLAFGGVERTAVGGGAGMSDNYAGNAGGSGGGGGGKGGGAGGAGVDGQGNRGGNGGGGGGGYAAAGAAGKGGAGGAGYADPLTGLVLATGGAGGTDGPADTPETRYHDGLPGTPSTGNGGDGAYGLNMDFSGPTRVAGAGGSGIVIVRYAVPMAPEPPTLDPSEASFVTVSAASAEEAEKAVVIVAPKGVANPDPDYASYFAKRATDNGDGTFRVSAFLDETKAAAFRPVLASGEGDTAFVVGEADAAITVGNAKAGLFYGWKAAPTVVGLDDAPIRGVRQATESGVLTLRPPRSAGETAGFFRVFVLPNDASGNGRDN